MKDTYRKVVLLTGATGGIGNVIAKRLAEEGCRMVLCGRKAEKLAQLAADMDDAMIYAGDMTEESVIADCMDKIIERYGVLDVVVNCAGMAYNGSFEETSTETLDAIMNINFRTPFLVCRAALPHLKKSDCATIVNIGSVVGHVGYANQAAYTASKHALLGMTRALAKEVYKDGIRVHMVSPGGVATEMILIARPDLVNDAMITPEEVADAVSMLVFSRGNAVIDEIRLHRVGKEPFQ
ncbi:MAG: SDR family oxidoreductase [Clostridia bacterium]|nr:SDR family oxidoreductase [Clostridia bacterium]